MPTPGIIHSGYSAVGIIGEVDWGEWDFASQKSFAFGVDGSSSIEGGFKMRPFTFPFMYWGYLTPGDRDFSWMQMELNIGTVGDFQANTAAFIIISLTNVRFAGVKPGRSGWDPTHGHWRQLFMSYEQLAPVVSVTGGQSGGSGSFGGGSGQS